MSLPVSPGSRCPAQFVFNIRGFNSFNVYRDGLLIGFAIPQHYDTANLQAVEVLKVPATFLFGRADSGGIINLVTKTPLALLQH